MELERDAVDKETGQTVAYPPIWFNGHPKLPTKRNGSDGFPPAFSKIF